MSLPTPFFEKQGVRIYCGDSREILDSIPKNVCDLVLTDPPYGIDQDPRKFDKTSTFTKVKDDDKPFDPFHQDAPVPGAIKNDDLPSAR